MNRDMEGATALVTGGSSGIGLAIARDLARRGAHVGLLARDPGRLAKAREEVCAASRPNRRVETFAVDVTNEGAVHTGAARALEALGDLDILVHCAGAAHPAAAHDTPSEVFHDMMNVNYFGTVYVTKAFLSHFRARKTGHIVGVSSVAGLVGLYGYAAYASSKFAVAGFFECLRQELRASGVQVSVVFPGDTNTPQLAAENLIKPEPTRAVSGNVAPLEPEEVARATVEGMLAGQFHIVPGRHAKAVALLARHFPGVVRFVTDRQVARSLGSTK